MGEPLRVNLILLLPEDLAEDGLYASVAGRRAQHIQRVHRAQLGQTLRVGVLDGPLGHAQVVGLSSDQVQLKLELSGTPPQDAGLHLVLALPRPKVLGRVLRDVATLGVKRLTLMNASRVEKSYWQNHRLQPGWIHEQLLLGLEQARDTLLPRVEIQRRFRPFVEDQLGPSSDSPTGQRLVLHPPTPNQTDSDMAPARDQRAKSEFPPAKARTSEEFLTLVVGPEGGFVPFELNMLEKNGFLLLGLGARILRVETVIPLALGRLRG